MGQGSMLSGFFKIAINFYCIIQVRVGRCSNGSFV